jgi:hypothetical protein
MAKPSRVVVARRVENVGWWRPSGPLCYKVQPDMVSGERQSRYMLEEIEGSEGAVK